MIHTLIKMMMGFFLCFFIFIIIPQIYIHIYGEQPYFIVLWCLFNFVPHALVLFIKRHSIVHDHKKLLYGVVSVYYLLITLSILLRSHFVESLGISNKEQLFQSLWVLLPIQLIYIFIIYLSTKTEQIPINDSLITLSKDNFQDKLRELVGNHRLEQAIALSLQFYKKNTEVSDLLIIQKSRLKAIKTNVNLGIWSLSDAEIERNKVSMALLDLLQE